MAFIIGARNLTEITSQSTVVTGDLFVDIVSGSQSRVAVARIAILNLLLCIVVVSTRLLLLDPQTK